MRELEQYFRRYERHECLGDGYPQEWHRIPGDGIARADDPSFKRLGIKHLVRMAANYRCLRCGHPYPPGITETHPRGEWTPCDEQCEHPGPVRWKYFTEDFWHTDSEWMVPRKERRDRALFFEAHWRILTVHHLDEDKANCLWWNLVALCQRCHLRMQRAVVMDRVYSFEHSEWFKPYAAGFYAWKYEGLELSREETMSRLEELLAHEQQFTQEAIF